jgi:hypothetical protein
MVARIKPDQRDEYISSLKARGKIILVIAEVIPWNSCTAPSATKFILISVSTLLLYHEGPDFGIIVGVGERDEFDAFNLRNFIRSPEWKGEY